MQGSDLSTDIGKTLAQLEKRLAAVERSSRLSSASIDDTSIQVRDGNGGLRALVGQQADGTTAVNVVNGPPPPAPSTPLIASVLGGVAASWDGTFADGLAPPLDWARVEVHAATASGFTPTPGTLHSTIETPQGATVIIATDDPVYVRFVARSTSGTPSAPSGQAGPLGPSAVVATDLLDGIVTELKLANDAVTAAKLATDAVDSTAIQDGAVLEAALSNAAVSAGKLANSAVTGPAIASDAVTADKIAANAVTTVELAANAVTAAKISAGAVTTDKLTVTGGANILTDPSFEGAYTTALVAGSAFATRDTTKGNGSPSSLKIDATSATAAFRSVSLTALPILPGEQLYLAVDYWVSTDWVGAEVSIQARWEDATGATLSYGKAVTTSPVREAWTRLTGTITAPANTVTARIRVESGSATAGTIWFDNAATRPVLGGTQIQDGAITTQKIIAGAILAGQIAASAVVTDKLAAEAVTAAKIAALAITTDKLDANSITTTKLAAGSVDATALKADAITGKTITGGDVNGATVTGGIVQTGTSGQRVRLNPAAAHPEYPDQNVPSVELHSGSASQLAPGFLYSDVSDDASAYPYATLRAPAVATAGAGLGPQYPITSEVRLVSAEPDVRGGSFAVDSNANPYFNEVGASWVSGASGSSTTDTSYVRLYCENGVDAPGGNGTSVGARSHLNMAGSQFQFRSVDTTADLSMYVRPSGVTIEGDLDVFGTVRPNSVPVLLTLTAGYTGATGTYEPPTCQLMPDGWVRLWGRFTTPGTWASGATAATIPAASNNLWPTKSHIFGKVALGVGKDAEVSIETTGALRIWFPSGTPTDITLAGITWPATA